MTSQGDNPFKVLLVFNRGFLAQLDELFEQGTHLLIIGGIGQTFLDDDPPQVVFDRLSHGFLILAQGLG